MDNLFVAVEQSGLSVWAREDAWAYFIALIGHAWGTALLAGGGSLLALRVLVAPGAAALAGFRGFQPVFGVAAVLVVSSGLTLLVAYPAKALTNPVFGLKAACLVAALLLTRRLLRGTGPGSRALAACSLAAWLSTVVAGKFLLHTARMLTVS
jgi:hypothetical protein